MIAPTIARLLALPPVLGLIERYAFRRPKGHLYDANGSLYMGRWRIIDESPWGRASKFGGAPRGLASRVLEKLTGYWAIRLHHINRADHDRDLHNHPFDYRTFVVRGWYDEVHLDARGLEATRRISAGQTSYSGGAFHRIAEVSPGGVWTVFVMGQNKGKWGFRIKTGHGRFKFVLSSKYFNMKQIADDGRAA